MHPSQVKSRGLILRARSQARPVPEGGSAISARPFVPAATDVFEIYPTAFGLALRNSLQVARYPGHATVRPF